MGDRTHVSQAGFKLLMKFDEVLVSIFFFGPGNNTFLLKDLSMVTFLPIVTHNLVLKPFCTQTILKTLNSFCT